MVGVDAHKGQCDEDDEDVAEEETSGVERTRSLAIVGNMKFVQTEKFVLENVYGWQSRRKICLFPFWDEWPVRYIAVFMSQLPEFWSVTKFI
jgi:hypothetical protein